MGAQIRRAGLSPQARRAPSPGLNARRLPGRVEAIASTSSIHISSLTPDPRNARKHSPRNVGTITDALREVGAARSIVIDENNVILAGNATIEAAADAGITKLHVVEADGQTVIAVRRTGLTPTQKARLALYDNRAAELADGWDLDVLKSLQADGVDLSNLWHDDELAELLSAEPTTGLTDPDDVPAERATDIKLGDLFQLGAHRLLCGDSTKVEDVARVMGGEKAALCLTDPPYGIGENYASHDDTPAELQRLIDGFFPLARSVSERVLLTSSNCNQRLYPNPDWTLCWFVSAGTGVNRWGFTCWHPVLAYGSDPYLAEGLGSRPDAMSKTESADNSLGHPCPKPVGVWAWFVERGSAHAGDVVYEPFSGSGTTLIACEQLGRRCYAIEIEPAYVQVAIDRWEQFTGRKAVKLT